MADLFFDLQKEAFAQQIARLNFPELERERIKKDCRPHGNVEPNGQINSVKLIEVLSIRLPEAPRKKWGGFSEALKAARAVFFL